MPLEILPSALNGAANIKVILKNSTSSILFKSLPESLENKKMYLASVAIVLVTKGQQIIQDYQQTRFIVKENEMVLLPKDLYVVSDFVTKESHFEAFIFFIDEQLISQFFLLNPIKHANSVQQGVLTTPSTAAIMQYIHSLPEIQHHNASAQALVDIKLLELLLLLGLPTATNPIINSLAKPMKRRSIKAFMQANYLNNLKISDYAALTGRSESTFNRDFKRLYGTTPKKWLIEKRLSKSHDLLNETDLNVTQVALEVGYENVSHFIEAYKKVYGVTPKLTLKHE